MYLRSLVESEHPVSNARPPGGNKGNTPETTMMLIDPPHNLFMCSVTEWCVWAHLAVAKFIVSTFTYVESDWSITSYKPLALSVTEWIELWMTTGAPWIFFSSVQIDMSREDTCICWQGWGSISTFFIGSTFRKCNQSLFWEVSHVVHWNSISRSSWFQDCWLWSVNISLMCLSFLKSWTTQSN